MAIVEMIVSNQHVGESYLSVIRTVIRKLKNGYQTFKALPRSERKKLLRQIVKAHKANRKLFQAVQNGFLV
jgi:hypothetical protein